MKINRRDAMRYSTLALGGMAAFDSIRAVHSQEQLLEKPSRRQGTLQVLNPRARVPLSFIIDDSTCLVNMGHFCMPQFAQAWPDRDTYRQPWRDWPREIPDSFVREFGEWCSEQGVKGKYSIVPYPACVGWLDRELPGWSRHELESSLNLVRDLMAPDWDIHPEMITHTRVIDLSTGRPMEAINAGTMENSYPQSDISTDHLAEYLAYALRILRNCGLHCDGITTPGGFGNRVKDKLPMAVHQAVRDVYGSELPHFFKYVKSDSESTAPTLEFLSEPHDVDRLTMNVPAGTGDWFGGWEGTVTPQPDLYCNEDATAGRMVDLIERGDPAVMLCHWPGMYCNGTKTGFHAFQRVVLSLASRFSEQTVWMKVSEIGRYWAAKELTKLSISPTGNVEISAPLRCEKFTFSVEEVSLHGSPALVHGEARISLQEVTMKSQLDEATFMRQGERLLCCVTIPKGFCQLEFA